MHTLYIIHPDSPQVEVRHWDKAGSPSLEVLQSAIGGGYIETVPHFTQYEVNGEMRRVRAYCDEDGRAKGLHRNDDATHLWLVQYLRKFPKAGPLAALRGKVVIVVKDR